MRYSEDDFVSAIVPEPSDPPDAILVVGFVGRSADKEMTRIYLDVMLGSFIDVRDTAVLHGKRIPETQSPLGGWYVWLKRDLELLDVVREAYARLGRLQQEYMDDLQQDMDGLNDLQPGWPQMPTG